MTREEIERMKNAVTLALRHGQPALWLGTFRAKDVRAALEEIARLREALHKVQSIITDGREGKMLRVLQITEPLTSEQEPAPSYTEADWRAARAEHFERIAQGEPQCEGCARGERMTPNSRIHYAYDAFGITRWSGPCTADRGKEKP